MAKQLKHVKFVRSKGHEYAYFNTGRKVAGKVIYARLPDFGAAGITFSRYPPSSRKGWQREAARLQARPKATARSPSGMRQKELPMTIEQQALALVNEVRAEDNLTPVDTINYGIWAGIALRRALERHEAFRREVSEAAMKAQEMIHTWVGNSDEAGIRCAEFLSRFIIAPPVDPLESKVVDVLTEAFPLSLQFADEDNARDLIRALAKHGLAIREEA